MKNFADLTRGLALVGVALIVSATPANAAPMLFTLAGEADGDLSASVLFSYAGLTASTGRVDVAVTNTSSHWDSRLTSVAFNLPGAVTRVSSFTSSLNGWARAYDRDDIDPLGQFGLYDVGALSGAHFNGGSPNRGIARNATATFAFNLKGAGKPEGPPSTPPTHGVPEPTTLLLSGLGLLALKTAMRRQA
jgi:hypothetical protein